jgi:RNA recognition motif-containing protein
LSKLRCILRKAHRHMLILDQVGMGSTQVFQPTIGIEHYDEELFKRTLYVGNLSKSTSEYVIKEIFSVIGNVTDVKMITHEGQPDSPPYCFVTFDEHENALQALKAFNGRNIHAKPIKVNWATRPDGIRKDTSKDHHIFVGDLSPEVTTSELRKHFEHFGEISEARVVRDAQTNRSKGYGFVAFINKVHAEKAIKEMNKATIGGKVLYFDLRSSTNQNLWNINYIIQKYKTIKKVEI